MPTHTGDWKRVLALLERRRLQGGTTVTSTYAHAIAAVCAASQFDRGLGLLNELKRAGRKYAC